MSSVDPTAPIILIRRLAEEMIAHVQAYLPEEACGILAGQGQRAETVIPVTNELHSPVRFRMAPIEQLEALVWLDDHQRDLVAIFHSHPTGPGYPSETDVAEFYYPGAAVIILSPGEASWQVRAFRIEDGQIQAVEVIYPREADTRAPGSGLQW